VACSPQANYTDRVIAACRIEGVTWSAQRILTAVNLGFLDRSRYFLETAPQLSSRGWVDPVPDPLLNRKSGSAGNPGPLTTRPQRRSKPIITDIKENIGWLRRQFWNTVPALFVFVNLFYGTQPSRCLRPSPEDGNRSSYRNVVFSSF
jgi:hypothetical protein